MRIALGLEYDGHRFCGWQTQPEGCGVQNRLEQALSDMAGHVVGVVAAGRTDAGVHALCQVVHFDTATERPLSAWVRGINANLPIELRVLWAQYVPDDFHARFSARRRDYQFVLYNSPVAPAVMANKSSWFHLPLDVEKMAEAAKFLQGEHDFSAFRASECQAKSPIRTLYQAEVKKHGDFIIFNFSGNAFLHHQVRNMVGALVYVGKGSHEPSHIQTLLQARDRTKSPPTFSSDGLYLTGVGYEAHWGLPSTRRYIQFFTSNDN
ncbi:MAG: tRNA pseudouridine(38-40) synthase TruA [Candidatus Methylopumilus sp.]